MAETAAETAKRMKSSLSITAKPPAKTRSADPKAEIQRSNEGE